MGRSEYIVPPGESRPRLDVFLSRNLGELTRSRIKKLIEGGHVLVDGRVPKAGALLSTGSLVTIVMPEVSVPDVEPQNIPLSILFEDSHLLVLDKAPHMVVHPAHGHPDGTLVNAILHHCEDLSGIGGVLRPGIVHRLDKGTSGVMVVAKDDLAHQSLALQFKEHTILRMYLAAVRGAMKDDGGIIDRPLGRHVRDRKRIAVREDGRIAVTEYSVRAWRGGVSLVELRPRTGRTHQLRVHLSSIGHPILGDSTYGGGVRSIHARDPQLRDILRSLTRPALHALRLEFVHPVTGSEMIFESPPPDDLAPMFGWIRGENR
ncbi:MAG TPA: RluA family pseudouridine synthase [Proteobacteria bacterium]|nr:ribosomal large subunit pseudouridine synthase D [bacterium BMS3Abin14]HDL54103.1 RluA family pseudouridine synthase [Pseudomonadota bacterium]